MLRLRKHIDRLDLLDAKAMLNQSGKIAGQAVRMTRNIDQRPRLHGSDGR